MFSLNLASLASYDAVVACFTVRFVHPANKLYESLHFHRHVQQSNESVDAYSSECCNLVKHYSYPLSAAEECFVHDIDS